MTDTANVLKKLNEHLQRQVRTSDQVKADLAEAFSTAAEVLLERQAEAVVTAAEQLQRQATSLDNLLTTLPAAEAHVTELLNRTQQLERLTGATAERLPGLVTDLDGALKAEVRQRVDDLTARLATLHKEFAHQMTDARADLARDARVLSDKREARVEALLTTGGGLLKQADEIARRMDDALKGAQKAVSAVAATHATRLETVLTGGQRELGGRLERIAAAVEAGTATIGQRQDRMAREDEARDVTSRGELDRLHGALARVQEACQQIAGQNLQLHGHLGTFDEALGRRLDALAKSLETGFKRSVSGLDQVRSDSQRHQSEGAKSLTARIDQIEKKLLDLDNGHRQRLARLQKWLLAVGAVLLLAVVRGWFTH